MPSPFISTHLFKNFITQTRRPMALRSFFFFFLAFASTSYSLPFVYFHGLNSNCSSDEPVISYFNYVAGVKGQCIEIGDGAHDALFMPMLNQIKIACDKVKELEYLKDGFNIVAVSQGTIIARGVIELCDGAPPVRNFISLAGPLAGVGALPCPKGCLGFQKLIDEIVYSDLIQDFMAPATYYKRPTLMNEYLEHSKLLPKLNNERPGERNSTYKDRFSSLENLVLIMNEDDEVLIPRETAWFWYFKDGSTTEVLPIEQTELYKEDWIGLRSLVERGRVKFYKVPGNHAQFTIDDFKNYVVPFLVDRKPLNNADNWPLTTKLLYSNA